MKIFTLLFLGLILLSFAVEYWLTRRHFAHIRRHRDQVPEFFRQRISLEAHQKAADYTIARGELRLLEMVVGLYLMLGFTLGGGIDILQSIWSFYTERPILAGMGLFFSVFLIMQLVELPIQIYQTFVVEQRFGFNRSAPWQFATDLCLQWLLSALIGLPFLAAVLWLMQHTGGWWWLAVWALLMSFSVLMLWAYPSFIAPLFNRFSPLEDQTLKERIEALLARSGFQSDGIFVMDGSRRSGHGNAYFTGFGNHKRIVFFDTLVNALSHDELEAVLAHELGHFKRRHLAKALCFQAAVTLLGLGLLGWLSTRVWFYHDLGVYQITHAATLLLFLLISPLLSVFLHPLLSFFQRRHEFEADDFAAQTAKPGALISALVKLYRDNATTLTPDPLYSAFHYSHPPAANRIANLSAKSPSSGPRLDPQPAPSR